MPEEYVDLGSSEVFLIILILAIAVRTVVQVLKIKYQPEKYGEHKFDLLTPIIIAAIFMAGLLGRFSFLNYLETDLFSGLPLWAWVIVWVTGLIITTLVVAQASYTAQDAVTWLYKVLRGGAFSLRGLKDLFTRQQDENKKG